MSTDEEIMKAGMRVTKEKELAKHRVDIDTHKQAIDFTYIKNKMHPERIDLNQLRVLCSNFIASIEAHQDTHREIEELG